MIINDISHIEVDVEAKNVQGGAAISNAGANASAYGQNFAGTSTSTFTNASSNYYSWYWWYYTPSNYASSDSRSSSAAY